MSTQSRTVALVSYILPLVGPAGALAARRGDPFVRYHATQALAIDLGALAAPLVWALLGWILTWVPRVGMLAGVLLFGLVLAVELVLLAARVLGIAWVARGELRPAPLVGGLAERASPLEESAPPPAAISQPEPAPEALGKS